jgi:hypothetical protein
MIYSQIYSSAHLPIYSSAHPPNFS